MGRRPDPLARVGVYAPGGRAAYPSSVLMGVVPARVAGVAEVILCSPPSPIGLPTPVVLAAAELANVDRVFALGGAGAIGAMAYGTASVPRVDRIVGPGNAYVAEAKTAGGGRGGHRRARRPQRAARHRRRLGRRRRGGARDAGPGGARSGACWWCWRWTRRRPPRHRGGAGSGPRRRSARGRSITEALSSRGGAVPRGLAGRGVDFANDFAAEHRCWRSREPRALLARLRNAGTVFLGESVLGGVRRLHDGFQPRAAHRGPGARYSGLSVTDFMRWTSYQRVDARRGGAPRRGRWRCSLTREGLYAHAAAARAWKER